MAGPVHPFRLILLAACLSPAARAQSAVPATPAAAEPPVSPKLAKLFAGTPPKYDPPKPGSTAPASAAHPPTDQPRNGIVRLPNFIVRGDHRLPDEYQILTPKGRDAAMAQRYLGPQSNLDHVLNAVTVADLWKKIPILGRFPFISSMSYNERAAHIYERPELKRRFNELLSIEQAAQELETPKAGDKPAK